MYDENSYPTTKSILEIIDQQKETGDDRDSLNDTENTEHASPIGQGKTECAARYERIESSRVGPIIVFMGGNDSLNEQGEGNLIADMDYAQITERGGMLPVKPKTADGQRRFRKNREGGDYPGLYLSTKGGGRKLGDYMQKYYKFNGHEKFPISNGRQKYYDQKCSDLE